MNRERLIQMLLLILGSLLFISCDEKPKNPVSEYGDALIGSYKRGQDAGEAANLDAVRKAVDAYRAFNDRYPSNLDEVDDLIGSDNIDLSAYDYDPESGTVSIKK
jgi:hypothetical protein